LSNVAVLKVKLKEGIDTSSLFGSHDAHLKMIEEALGIRVSARGEEVLLNGPADAVRNGERLLGGLTNLMSEGFTLRRDDVEYAIRNLMGGEDPSSMKESLRGGIEVGNGKRVVVPKTPTQRRYIEAIRKHDLVLGIGPAGTGKTYLAMAMAVASLSRREVNRIILARPAVEAGEKLGFLPGDMIA
jgi:phosphate starvation-inducible PhoH-like protein